jgi:hypothetical protein
MRAVEPEHPLITARRMMGERKPDEHVEFEGQQVPVHRLTTVEDDELKAQGVRFSAGLAKVPLDAFALGWLMGRFEAEKLHAPRNRKTKTRLLASLDVAVPAELYGDEFGAALAAATRARVFIAVPPSGARYMRVTLHERGGDGG